jgi:hypothetical protein
MNKNCHIGYENMSVLVVVGSANIYWELKKYYKKFEEKVV